ncbi:NfeD family protein [uncultured Oscillibacter sp.]|uniref:NfeD family protein n=1 Tax=uncultured Oscillibacter sp. TaxID=876091 RepID=UPI00260CEFDA|nr:NfeD family protein [uncultured Oscillibacter sp.]
MNLMVWLWLGGVALFGVVELLTEGLVSVWFVVGALAALAVSVAGGSVAVQMLTFAIVSAAALILTRPLVRRFMTRPPVPTNSDRVIGALAEVTETIDNRRASGAVYVDGKTWTARSAGGGVIPAGERVRVRRIEGVKLLVEPDQLEQSSQFEKEAVS